MNTGLSLDPRLAADTLALGDLPLCRLLWMRDANYPWAILVPRRESMTEIYQLAEVDQWQLQEESSALAAWMADFFRADKMNVANLGNIVAQLHVHHIVRFEHDPAWPGPVWGKLPARPYSEGELDSLCKRMLPALQKELGLIPC